MKVTVKGVLHWHKYTYQEHGDYQIWSNDMSSCGPEYAPIQPVECSFEIPDDFDPVPGQIAALRAKKQEILAETQLKVNNLEEQIQSLLCIEHKPELTS